MTESKTIDEILEELETEEKTVLTENAGPSVGLTSPQRQVLFSKPKPVIQQQTPETKFKASLKNLLKSALEED